jgi:hypothetical protein
MRRARGSRGGGDGSAAITGTAITGTAIRDTAIARARDQGGGIEPAPHPPPSYRRPARESCFPAPPPGAALALAFAFTLAPAACTPPPAHPSAPDMACAAAPCPPRVAGSMSLVELAGTQPSATGPQPIVLLDARASFHPLALAHAYDDRAGGALGCVADHFDAAHPAPADGDAGSLRMSGFAGGTLLDGSHAANPIVCARFSDNVYSCIYPTGAIVARAPMSAPASPLGGGAITFATGAGADFGAQEVSGSAGGTLALAEDLASLRFAAGDTLLHPSCPAACPGARVAVRLTARASSGAAAFGTSYCVYAMNQELKVPIAATAAMLANDASLDTIDSEVALLAAAPLTASDDRGNPLTAELGRGLFASAPR